MREARLAGSKADDAAPISVRIPLSDTSAGTRPFALIARYAGMPIACAAIVGQRGRWCRGSWCVMGDSYTICDRDLFTLAQWLEADGVDPARFPKIRSHRQRMSDRPAAKTALATELA
jgi:glutathione S-transferase